MPKRIQKQKPTPKRQRPERWTDQHRTLCHLLEEELHGLVQYLRALHYLSILLVCGSVVGIIIAVRALFANGEHAVAAFITIIVTCVAVLTAAILSLRPWVLPRFLLPIDIHELRYDDMLLVTSSPREYIHLLKRHVQKLTESYLLRKLSYLRHAITIFVFGVAVAVVLSVALP